MELRYAVADEPFSGEFLIIANQLRTAKNGRSYLAMRIGDGTGELPVKIWDADVELFNSLEAGRVIALQNIRPRLFNHQIQLEWNGRDRELFRVLPEAETDYQKFLPQSPSDLNQCWDFLAEVIVTIDDPVLQRVLSYFFSNPDFKAAFIRVPAALKRHHAYIGGLLEHTAGVTAICKAAAEYYPLVKRDLLLTGAILHDIGKVKTYQITKGFDGTTEGKLIGHLVLGVEMVEEAFANLNKGYERGELHNRLIHLLVSHHGIMEWGSPVEPLTLEACILHHADNLDAQVTKYLTVMRSEVQPAEWSAFDPGLGRSLFLGSAVEPEEESSTMAPESSSGLE